jgi:hypothetical protein
MNTLQFLVESDNMLIAHSRDLGVVFTSGAKTTAASSPTMPRVDPHNSGSNSDIESWGEDNNFPAMIIDLYSKNTLIPRLLGDKASELVGGGLVAVKVTGFANGQEQYEYVNDTEITEWLDDFQLNRAVFEMANDLLWFFNGWVELIPSVDRTKIVGIVHQEAAFCRWQKQNASGKCENVIISSDWATGNKDIQKTLPAIDPYAWDSVERVRQSKKTSFLYHFNIPTVGKTFYQLAYHDAVRTSGWLEILQAVPSFKKYLLKNSMSIKYHFEIDEAYWPAYFGDKEWDKAKPEEKLELKRKWLKGMTDALTDVDKAGNSIVTEKVYEMGQLKDYRSYVTIHVLNDATKDGSYIKDVLEGNNQVLYAFGFDPTTIGYNGGDGQAQRSGGSDKSQAWQINNLRLQPTRNFLLEPIRWAARYNGWEKRHPGLKIMTKDSLLTKSDPGETPKTESKK